MISRPQNRSLRRGGFTLIEILVAVLLLSLSLAALVTLWSVSRKITERTRDTSEYYAIARQEVERDRAGGFNGLPIPVGSTTYTRTTDYNQNGTVTATSSALYRAVSTYTFVPTNATAEPAGKQLGVQVVKIYAMNNGTVGTVILYQTTMFFTSAGV